jgi:hypothetical protein
MSCVVCLGSITGYENCRYIETVSFSRAMKKFVLLFHSPEMFGS